MKIIYRAYIRCNSNLHKPTNHNKNIISTSFSFQSNASTQYTQTQLSLFVVVVHRSFNATRFLSSGSWLGLFSSSLVFSIIFIRALVQLQSLIVLDGHGFIFIFLFLMPCIISKPFDIKSRSGSFLFSFFFLAMSVYGLIELGVLVCLGSSYIIMMNM